MGKRPINVMANVEVGIAVAVEVAPAGAGRPQVIGQAGLLRYLDEAPATLAVRLIVIQDEPAVAGDEKIGPAVAVVVGRGATVRVKDRPIDSRLARHVLKAEGAEVLVQLVRMSANFLSFKETAAGDEEVEQAVAVVVEERDAAAERLQDGIEARFLAVLVHGLNAGFGSHVAKEIRSRGHDLGRFAPGRRVRCVRASEDGGQLEGDQAARTAPR